MRREWRGIIAPWLGDLCSDRADVGLKNLPIEYVNLEAKDVTQLVELLPNVQEALGLTPATA